MKENVCVCVCVCVCEGSMSRGKVNVSVLLLPRIYWVPVLYPKGTNVSEAYITQAKCLCVSASE